MAMRQGMSWRRREQTDLRRNQMPRQVLEWSAQNRLALPIMRTLQEFLSCTVLTPTWMISKHKNAILHCRLAFGA